MLLLIALSCFLTIVLGLLAVAGRPRDLVAARAEALGFSGRTGPGLTRLLIEGQSISSPARLAIAALRGFVPQRWYERLERTLREAGDPVDAGRFLLLWGALALALLTVGLLFAGPRGLLVGLAAGFLGPFLWVRRVAKNRRNRISRALPDAIDLLVACVEAGLGIEAALVRVGDATDGPLGEELRRTLREIAVGHPRQEALLELGARTGVTDLDGFLRPVVQAEKIGVSIGEALRVQAEALRERRRQRAREKAEKLPAKMVIPMTLFFLPAVMLIGMAPAAFELAKIFADLGG